METSLQQTVDPDQLLSMNQAAKLLGVNRTLLTGALIGSGVTLIRINRTLVVKRCDLNRVAPLLRKEP
jgi:hypothetical protein